MGSRTAIGSMFYGAKLETFRRAKELRKNMTVAELILWKKLNDEKIFQSKFRRQHPIDIYIVDFYNHKNRLIVEIDGEIHRQKTVIENDAVRNLALQRLGLKIIRFSNHEVIFEIDSVLEKIRQEINE